MVYSNVKSFSSVHIVVFLIDDRDVFSSYDLTVFFTFGVVRFFFCSFDFFDLFAFGRCHWLETCTHTICAVYQFTVFFCNVFSASFIRSRRDPECPLFVLIISLSHSSDQTISDLLSTSIRRLLIPLLLISINSAVVPLWKNSPSFPFQEQR